MKLLFSRKIFIHLHFVETICTNEKKLYFVNLEFFKNNFRALGEISRSLDKNEAKDKYAFYAMKGFQTLARLFGLMADQKQSCVIPLKSVISTSLAWKLACRSHRPNTEYVLKTNYVTLIVDILLDRLNLIIPDEHR